MNSWERTREVAGPAGLPLNLAAGRFWDNAGRNQDNGVRCDSMMVKQGALDFHDDFGETGLLGVAELLHDDQAFFAACFDGEGGGATGAERLIAVLDGKFKILRIVIAAVEDDQVLQTAGDEQLAVVEEAQIAGAQEGALLGVLNIGNMGAEGALSVGGLVPISEGDVGAGNPDFTDVAGRAFCRSVKIDDGNLLAGGWRTDTDQDASRSLQIGLLDDTVA